MAQCDKDVFYSATKAEFLDSNGTVQKTEETHVTVQISHKKITLTHNDDVSDQLTGEIKNLECNWSDPLSKAKRHLKRSC